jgi:hypothetical protein
MATVNGGALTLLGGGLLGLFGCGTTGDVSALPDHFPRAGLSGYVARHPDAPPLAALAGADLDEPTLQLPTADSTSFTLWGRLATATMPQRSQLFRLELPSLDGSADAGPEPGLTATLPWEGQGLHGATWLNDSQPPILLYQGEDGSVGLASWDGGALTKRSLAAPLISAATLGGGRPIGRVGAALQPSAEGGRLRLYYTVADAEVYRAQADATAVLAQARGEAATVAWQVRPTGLRADAFLVPPGDTKALPAESISGLGVRRLLTPVGRPRWDLFVVASQGKKSALIAASSYEQSDGDEQFAAVVAPLYKSDDGTPLSPTVTSYQGRPLLLCGVHQVQTVIVAAVQPL